MPLALTSFAQQALRVLVLLEYLPLNAAYAFCTALEGCCLKCAHPHSWPTHAAVA